jgi:hypothetical protein
MEYRYKYMNNGNEEHSRVLFQKQDPLWISEPVHGRTYWKYDIGDPYMYRVNTTGFNRNLELFPYYFDGIHRLPILDEGVMKLYAQNIINNEKRNPYDRVNWSGINDPDLADYISKRASKQLEGRIEPELEYDENSYVPPTPPQVHEIATLDPYSADRLRFPKSPLYNSNSPFYKK